MLVGEKLEKISNEKKLFTGTLLQIGSMLEPYTILLFCNLILELYTILLFCNLYFNFRDNFFPIYNTNQ